MSEISQKKKLTKKQLIKSFFIWNFFSHASYNYERLMGIGFSMCMFPILKALYSSKEEFKREMEKHVLFFNTEPNLGDIIHGIVCAMEEERANTGGVESPITPEAIIGIKSGLMGPFAGVGDTLIQGIFTPLFISIGIGMAMEGNMIGPWFALFGNAAAIFAVAYTSWMYGYRWGGKAVDKLLGGGLMDMILRAAGILGCLVMGALVAQYVSVYTPISIQLAAATATESAKNLVVQTSLFDAILKGILSLGATVLTLRCFRRGWSVNKIMAVLAIGGFVLGAVGILSNVAPT